MSGAIETVSVASSRICRVPDRSLTAQERQAVYEVLYGERFRDRTPPEIYAACHMASAARLYMAGQFAEARGDVLQAVKLDRSLLDGRPARIVRAMVGCANNPRVVRREEFLIRLCAEFPPIVPHVAGHLRKAWAETDVAKSIDLRGRGRPKEAWRILWQGIRRDPSLLRDRRTARTVAATLTDLATALKRSGD